MEEISAEQGNNTEYKVGYCKPPLESRWKPGQSGNPKGPPKDPGITATQRGMLDTICPYDTYSPRRTWREWLAERGLVLASEKEMALEHLKERLEGKVLDTHEFKGELILRIVDDEEKDNGA